MSLFNIAGSGEWGVSEADEKLCENFKKESKNLKKKKSKKKVISNKFQQIKKVKVEKILQNGKTEVKKTKNKVKNIIKQTKNNVKLMHQADDKVPLRNESFSHETSKKKKRKHEPEITHNEPSKKRKKKIKNKDTQQMDEKLLKKRKQQLEQLKQKISQKSEKPDTVLTLRQKMMTKLKAARFRFLNEQIYSTTSKDAEKLFRQDPEAFKAYHDGYKLQVKRWPLNPVDKIIKSLNKMNKSLTVADFGCGEAKLAQSVQQTVHSFDLVAANDLVVACDMARVPLKNESVDVAVFCLSLMGTNLKDYLLEANRVLKKGGILKIAEVESRFDNIDEFTKNCESFGFKKTWMDLTYNLFYFLDFKKVGAAKDKKKLPAVSLLPCLYKKR